MFRPAKESDCCDSRVKRVVTRSDDKAEKGTVTLNEERGGVTSVEEGLDVVKDKMSAGEAREGVVDALESHKGSTVNAGTIRRWQARDGD